MNFSIVPSGKIFEVETNKVLKNALKQINITEDDVYVKEENLGLTETISEGEITDNPATLYLDDVNDSNANYRGISGVKVSLYPTTSTLSLPRKKEDDSNYFLATVAPTIKLNYKVETITTGYPTNYDELLPNGNRFNNFAISSSAVSIPMPYSNNGTMDYEYKTTLHSRPHLPKTNAQIEVNIGAYFTIKVTINVEDSNATSTSGYNQICTKTYTISPFNISTSDFPAKLEQTSLLNNNFNFTYTRMNKIEVCVGWYAVNKPLNGKLVSNANDGLKLVFTLESTEINWGESVLSLDSYGKITSELQVNNPVGDEVLSVGNDFIRANNKYIPSGSAQSIYQKTLQEYQKGKETATIECAISDYLDDNNGYAISPTSAHPLFDIHDKVLPFTKSKGTLETPISTNENDIGKVFEVLGTSLIYDGHLRQKLYLQEERTWNLLPSSASFLQYDYDSDGDFVCTGRDDTSATTNFISIAATNAQEIVVQGIGYRAFQNSSIKAVHISRAIKIKQQAFSNCTHLQYVYLPYDLERIETQAFNRCDLQNIVFPNSLKHIGSNILAYNNRIKEINIPRSVTFMYGFGNCDSLENIFVDKDNTQYCSYNGNVYDKKSKALVAYSIGKKDKRFIIPFGTSSINHDAFGGNKNLKILTIPNSVTLIAQGAFVGGSPMKVYYTGTQQEWEKLMENQSSSSALSKSLVVFAPVIAYDQEVSYIEGINGDYTDEFLPISAQIDKYTIVNEIHGNLWGVAPQYVKEIDIDNRISYISSGVFSDFHKLTTLHIAPCTIEENAFKGCTKLQNVYFKGTQEQWYEMWDGYVGDGNEPLKNANVHFVEQLDIF